MDRDDSAQVRSSEWLFINALCFMAARAHIIGHELSKSISLRSRRARTWLPIRSHIQRDTFRRLDAARTHAFASADNHTILAHSIILKSDDGSISERWVREDNRWQKIGA